MAKSIDVAVTLLKKSIQLGKDNPDYYIDYVKLHKLMYLGYCVLSYLYGIDLFEEKIIARDDGPYIEGLNSVPVICGYGKITNIKEIEELEKNQICIIPISLSKKELCDLILDNFGMLDGDSLVKFTKNTSAYLYAYTDKYVNEIHKNLLPKTGKDIAENILSQQESHGIDLVRDTNNKTKLKRLF